MADSTTSRESPGRGSLALYAIDPLREIGDAPVEPRDVAA
jgi:hypothetical protein